MRTTLTLDDDVAALLRRAQKKNDVSFKELVNQALRQGLEKITSTPGRTTPFRTRAVDLGRCNFPNLDNIWEVLAEAEGKAHK